MYRNAVRERISFFECGLTVKFLLFHSGSLCWPTVGAVSSPPRRPALAILRKPASGTSTFPIRNALTISAKRLQSGRKHSFVIVDVLCPPLPYFTLMSCVLHPTASLCETRTRLNLTLFSFTLQPSKRGLPKALCWRLVACACLVALLPCTAVTTLAIDNVGHRANRVSQRQMGNRWPYQL
jgi:hypothetical protein